MQPLSRIKEEMEPIRAASFEQDVKPFAEHIALSVVMIFAGIIIAVVFWLASKDYPQIAPFKYIAFPTSILIFIYGLSRFFIQLFLLNDYLERQWKTKTDIEDYQEGGQVKKNTIWLTLDSNHQVALPDEPLPGAYANLAVAYLAGEALFSELGSQDKKGATHFGFSTNEYNGFRKVMLDNNLAVWRDPHNAQQGVALTPRGDRMMAELASTGPAALEQFIN